MFLNVNIRMYREKGRNRRQFNEQIWGAEFQLERPARIPCQASHSAHLSTRNPHDEVL